MKKLAVFFAGICGMVSVVSAQTFTNTRLLNENASRLKLTNLANFAKALSMAKEKGWQVRAVTKTGRVVQLIGVDDAGYPKYYITDNNTTAAATVRTSQLWPGGASGLNLTGGTPYMKNKLGIWDGGNVLGTHVELAGRVTQKDNGTVDDHATHVTGTMIASGVNPAAKGMAFGLLGMIAYNFDNDQSEMNAEAASGLLLSNHSYSRIAGWYYNDEQARWEFRGRASDNEDYKFGYYGDESATLDELTYNAPFYLVVKSAGNVRVSNGPEVGADYFRYNASGTMAKAATGRPASLSSNNAYDVISLDVGAKNILTVGAVNPLPTGYSRKEDVVMTSFSGWGPTDDGRIKPDIVADGVNVLSSISTSNTAYSFFSGTSMAAPNATGSLFLLQEYYSKLKNSSTAFLRSATLKGLAIHTAEEAGLYDGPDYQYGWGLLNVEKAAAVLTAAVPSNNGATSASRLYETSLAQGASFSVTVVASGKGKLQATICWTDVKGNVVATPSDPLALNNRTKNLVNDLDIRITKGARTYLPWVLDVANPSNPATRGDNITDNVERIDIDSTVPGQTYVITVTHKGTLVKGPQAFSLLVSGVGGSVYCTSASGGGGARIDSVSFRNVQVQNSAGAKTYTDNTGYIANIEPGQTVPISVRVNTADATTNSRIVKVFIDYNNNGVFDLPAELAQNSGILNSASQIFTGNIVVPSTVSIGSIGLMRIVVQETSNLADINPCGNYGKGETMDFTVRVVSPSNDMSIAEIVVPQSLDCGTDSIYATVALRNSGTVSQSNIPVSLSFATSSGATTTLTGTYPGPVPALSTHNFTFQKPITLVAGTGYVFTATVSQPTDQFSGNNQLVSSITTAAKPGAISATGSICTTNALLKVNNPGSGHYYWYTSPTSTQPIALGTNVSTTTIPANNTYYVASEARVSIGPATKMAYTNGGYNHFNGNFVRFNNAVPVVLESVRLYVGNPGKIKFTVANLISENADGSYSYSEISSTVVDAFATKPNPGPNPTSATTNENPVDDTGAVFHLGLPVPVTGDHIIQVTLQYPDGTPIPNSISSTGASLFRNGGITGANTYPMGIDKIMQFTGNSATGTGVSQSQFYYFFYDLKVNTGDCVSDRVAVVATTPPTPVAAQVGNQLTSSITTGIQWYLGTTAVSGATASPFTPTQNGAYKVVYTDPAGCQKTSNTVNFVITAIDPVVAAREIDLKVSPNPNTGVFNLSFVVTDKADLSIEIVNAAGQKVFSQSQKNFVGRYSRDISVPALASEVYMLKINHNKKNYVHKIVTTHK